MRGRILHVDYTTGEGVISGEDGKRYSFKNTEWKGQSAPSNGQSVDFQEQGDSALAIYKVGGDNPFAGDKNKLVAGILGIFLGWVGVHKFYLGYKNPGIVMAVMGIGGFLTSWLLIGLLPLMIVSVIGFIEGILYIVCSDEEFERKYVQGRKEWF